MTAALAQAGSSSLPSMTGAFSAHLQVASRVASGSARAMDRRMPSGIMAEGAPRGSGQFGEEVRLDDSRAAPRGQRGRFGLTAGRRCGMLRRLLWHKGWVPGGEA